MRRGALFALAALAIAWSGPVGAAVPRQVPRVAEIVTVKGDEQVQFIDDPRWRAAEIKQDLAAGDGLRTGPYGGLAVLFQDQTQIRIHRNSTLIVKDVRARGGAGETLLRLERGAAWSRGQTLPGPLRMETPSATAAIRGTDWHLRVEDDGRSTLTVLAGEVDFANPFGSVTVRRGEIAVAVVGAPPTKTILLNPRDRPQWELAVTPDWIRIIPVAGYTTGGLKQARETLTRAVERERAPETLLDLAEVVYEQGEIEAATRLVEEARLALPQRPDLRGRIRLVDGVLLAARGAYAEAAPAFEEASQTLRGRHRMIAFLGRFLLLVVAQRYDAAETALAALLAAFDEFPEVHLARIQLTSFRGEQDRAIALAREGQARFPDDSRFSTWLAHLSLVIDDPDLMRRSLDAALKIDDQQFLAWHLEGTYHHFVRPDPVAARRAYERTIEISPNYPPPWNNLALLFIDLGDYEAARRAVLTAQRLAPGDTVYKVTYASLLALVLDRLDEGETLARAALADDPMDSSAMLLLGSIALRRDKLAEAIEWMLRAGVANPGLAGANTSLAIAHYQAERFDLVRPALENAIRLDANDPVPPLIGSIMAQDQAEAGRAIRLAREALDRYLTWGNFAVESLASSQSGIVNLGSAYTNLGLDAWGEFYGQLSFDPTLATSHFFLANRYPSPRARRGEATQGLLLDPLATSARQRYFDFVRRPFTDVTLGATVGSDDGGFLHAQQASAQGFARLPTPVSYFVNFQRTQTDGFRENTAQTRQTGLFGLGARLDPRNDLLVTLSGSRARSGIPGIDDAPDPDDRSRSSNVEGVLGYHHRFGPASHLMARLAVGYFADRFRNTDAFGTTFSDRSASLIRSFGVAPARGFYDFGLCDITGQFGFIERPTLFLGGPLCEAVGATRLASDIPDPLDLNPLRGVDNDLIRLVLQARHLVGLGPVRLTYGVEWSPSRLQTVARAAEPVPVSTGGLIADNLLFRFPFTATRLARTARRFDRQAVEGYVDADWAVARSLRLEAGVFLRHFDDDDRTDRTQADPRLGLAWLVTPGHWLRAAVQRALVLPIDSPLGPVAAVGLLANDAFTTEGSSVTDYQVRWDAEWAARFFTAVIGEELRIRRFFDPVPFSIDAFRITSVRIQRVTAIANAWLSDQWGAFARHRWTWTENRARDANRGNDVPLAPDRLLDLGVVWVHPLQIRASASASYVGRRAADLENTRDLDSYWTVNASVNWQPMRRHWSITLAGSNILNDRHELARGIPAPGPTVTLTAEYRF
jgi:tetratricopeptide (TPR) repeat protein